MCPLLVFSYYNNLDSAGVVSDIALKMYKYIYILTFMNTLLDSSNVTAFVNVNTNLNCGPYGFVCDGISKLRLCEDDTFVGPTFICPPNTICNEESSDVCENPINYIDPVITRAVRCHRSERIADSSVPNCKGYILCIPNKNRFQGIKFQCSGNTIFNGYTRTCTAPNKYKCPMANVTKSKPQYYGDLSGKVNSNGGASQQTPNISSRPIDCRNYRFAVTQDSNPARATYFCPSRPVSGQSTIRCTVFSNNFCLTLERDAEDQFLQSTGTVFRKPRKSYLKH